MPLKLKVILVGERESLADFQEMEPGSRNARLSTVKIPETIYR